MRSVISSYMPISYYLLKRHVIQSASRYSRRLRSNGTVERQILGKSPRCILIYEAESSSKRYRIDHAQNALESLDLPCYSLPSHLLDSINNYDFLRSVQLVLLHRLPMNAGLKSFMRHCMKAGIPIFLDLDDAIHDPDIYQRSAIFDQLNGLEQKLHLHMSRKVKETLVACDAVTVSTLTLGQYVSDVKKNVFHIPNRISQTMQKAMFTESQERNHTLRIGYICGTNTHDRDFLSIARSIETMLQSFPEAELVIAGPLSVPIKWRSQFSERIISLPLTSFPDYLNYYSSLTVSIAPLEPENPFCMAKSGVKFLEASLSETPTIAYPTCDFRRLIKPEETGFLAKTPTDWKHALHRCLTDPMLAQKVGKSARNMLRSQTVADNIPLWKECFSKMRIIS